MMIGTMRYGLVTLLILLLFGALSTAQQDFSPLPTCAKNCFSTSLQASKCASLNDISCICKEATVITTAKSCVMSSCSYKQALTSLNVTDTACGVPARDHSIMYRTVNIVFFTLATLALLSRFATHLTVGRIVWQEEVTMGIILVLNVALFAVAVIMSITGLGKDMWKVPFEQISKTLLYFWLSEMLYFLLLSVIKVSFLLFYLNIFPKKAFRLVVWGLAMFNVAMGLSFVLAVAFSCRPISYMWTQWSGENTGTCSNNNALAFTHAAFSIVMDFITLALPVTQIWNLQLAFKKKMQVLLMFSVGAFVTIVSILRLRSLIHFANTADMTWDYLEASLWSIIEVNVGIICACMPAIRLGLVRLFPSILGSTRQSTSKTPYGPSDGGTTQGVGNTAIAVSTTLRVSHTRRPQVNDESSFVQLVEIEADAKSTGSNEAVLKKL